MCVDLINTMCAHHIKEQLDQLRRRGQSRAEEKLENFQSVLKAILDFWTIKGEVKKKKKGTHISLSLGRSSSILFGLVIKINDTSRGYK